MRVHRHITTRSGGVSVDPFASLNLATHVGDDPAAVAANRRLLAERIGVPADRIVWMDQTHSTHVATVDSPVSAPLPETDAVVTATPGLALAVMTADCVPVLLWDNASHVIAAAHAGRVGARNGIIARTIEAMVSAGADPARIEVYLAPAASGPNYEVPADMQADVVAHLPGSGCETAWGTTGLDLRVGIEHQLCDLGVTRIEHDARCTIEDESLFSHRREGRTGRIASLIWMTDD